MSRPRIGSQRVAARRSIARMTMLAGIAVASTANRMMSQAVENAPDLAPATLTTTCRALRYARVAVMLWWSSWLGGRRELRSILKA